MTKPAEQSYTVVSGRVVGCEPGDTITAKDLPTANMGQLVAAGHIKPKKGAT